MYARSHIHTLFISSTSTSTCKPIPNIQDTRTSIWESKNKSEEEREIHITVKFWRRSISNPVSFSPSKTISSPFAQYFTIHMIDSVLIRRCLLFISLCIFVSFLRFVLCAFLFLLQFDSRIPVWVCVCVCSRLYTPNFRKFLNSPIDFVVRSVHYSLLCFSPPCHRFFICVFV